MGEIVLIGRPERHPCHFERDAHHPLGLGIEPVGVEEARHRHGCSPPFPGAQALSQAPHRLVTPEAVTPFYIFSSALSVRWATNAAVLGLAPWRRSAGRWKFRVDPCQTARLVEPLWPSATNWSRHGGGTIKAALQNYQARMRRVLDYIDRHLDSDLNLET